jgi:hypothetical protein
MKKLNLNMENNMDSICVTGLYNIGREAYDGRKWDDYLNWFEKILKLKTPMVVYGDLSLRDWVLERRVDNQTWFVAQSLHDIPYYGYRERVSSIIRSAEFRTKVCQPQRLECNLVEYTLVIYSKLHWMIDAVKKYGTESTKVFWVDAGCSRFIDSRLYDHPFPNKEKTDFIGDKFFIQMSRNYPDLITSESLPSDYFWLAKPLTAAGFMGGSIKTVETIADGVKQIFENDMLDKGVVATEENAIGAMIKKRPELFFPVVNTSGHPLQSIHMLGTL